MRRLQLSIGIAMVIAFLGSGAYMHFRLDHLRGMPLVLRMVYRASHINLLLIGAFNIASARREESVTVFGVIAGRISSALAIAAAVFLLIAFAIEPGFTGLYRPWTRLAVYSTFAAILLEVAAVAYSPRR